MEPTGCPKGRHSAWAPNVGFRSAIGEREFVIASGGPPRPFQTSSAGGAAARFETAARWP